jgi:CubicO group peptidase (beta-lactamase class C family)
MAAQVLDHQTMRGPGGRIALALTLTAALVAFSGQPATTQNLDANLALFERYLEALRRIAHVPGISGVIVRDGRPVWQRGFGVARHALRHRTQRST